MTFKESLTFRHACKVFDESKSISAAEFNEILEAGRLSPSSFGLQHWKFLVIENAELREKLKAVCWNQAQITTASKLVIVLARISELLPDSEYLLQTTAKGGKTKEQHEAYLARYKGFFDANIASNKDKLFGWSKAQCFLAAQNMMTQAAILGIDSCPIEGFEEDKVLEILKINRELYRVALILPFGYRVREASTKSRHELDKIVEYIK